MNFQLPLQINWIETWLATPEPWNTSLFPGWCVWDHCHSGRSSHISSSVLSLMEGDFCTKFIISFTQASHCVPFGEKWLQCMMLPPSCSQWFLGCNSVIFFSFSNHLGFILKSSILFSSGHTTFSQSSSGSVRWFQTNFRGSWKITSSPPVEVLGRAPGGATSQ